MTCPVCKEVVLQVAERQGIEVDYCPQCRGMWLDRGEIDKIVQHIIANGGGAAGPVRPSEPPRDDRERIRKENDRYRKDDEDDHYKRRDREDDRRGGFLGGLLDIFD